MDMHWEQGLNCDWRYRWLLLTPRAFPGLVFRGGGCGLALRARILRVRFQWQDSSIPREACQTQPHLAVFVQQQGEHRRCWRRTDLAALPRERKSEECGFGGLGHHILISLKKSLHLRSSEDAFCRNESYK